MYKRQLRERVRAQLLELISEMDLTVNTRLLSEGQLAAKFQVSRSTIRTVLSDLEVEGKVIRRQGSGTYVNSQAIQVNTTLYPRIDLREIVARNGYSARSEVLYVRQIPAGRQSLLFNCGPTHQPVSYTHLSRLLLGRCGDGGIGMQGEPHAEVPQHPGYRLDI